MATQWCDLNILEKTTRMNELKRAINIGGRSIDDENILMLATQNYVPSDRNIQLLIHGKAGIDELRNTRTV